MKRKTIIKLHLVFWLVTSSIALLSTIIHIGKAPVVPLLSGIFIRIFFHIVSFYLFYFLISPKFFNKKGIIFLTAFEVGYLGVSSLVVSFIYFLPFMFYYSVSNPLEYILKNLLKINIFFVISGHTIFSILGILSKVSLIWYENKIKQKEIEKQNISIELAMLRAQINPHFLFNTLNNIKSLIQRLPSKAIYSIDKLKGIMHYMLYESSIEKVSLKDEINHIKNYLDLEQIRYYDPNYINFKVSGDLTNVTIPPLIFMPFIENAFKHGDKLSPAPGVDIKLEVNRPNITFEIINYIKENSDIGKKNSGFGLSNIKRRLDLLFDKKYKLEINRENKTFIVKLNLIYI